MDTICCKEFLGETFESEIPENGYISGDVLCLYNGAADNLRSTAHTFLAAPGRIDVLDHRFAQGAMLGQEQRPSRRTTG